MRNAVSDLQIAAKFPYPCQRGRKKIALGRRARGPAGLADYGKGAWNVRITICTWQPTWCRDCKADNAGSPRVGRVYLRSYTGSRWGDQKFVHQGWGTPWPCGCSNQID